MHQCLVYQKNYKVLQSTLGEVQDGHDEYAAKVSWLFSKLEQFETYFRLQLAHVLFVPVKQFSFNVQAVDITVREAVKGPALLVSHLKSLTTDTMFNRFYEKNNKQISVINRSAKASQKP